MNPLLMESNPFTLTNWFVSEKRAYVLDSDRHDGNSELIRFDLTIPTAPQFIDRRLLPQYGRISLWNNILFISHSNGIDFLDTTDELNQFATIELGENQYHAKIEMVGTLAYVSSTSSSHPVRVYDLSDPANPEFRASFSSDAFSINTLSASLSRLVITTIFGEFGYCASSVHIADLENPETAQTALDFDPQNCLSDSAIDNDTLFLVGQSGLMIYDLADIEAPQRLSHFFMPSGLQDAQAAVQQDQYVYILSSEGRGHVLKTIDLANPAAPLVGTPIELQNGSPLDLFIQDNLLFIPVWMEGFWIFDIQNPAQPQLLSPPQRMEGITSNHRTFALFNHFVVIPKYEEGVMGGLVVIDFNDPENPVEVALFETGHHQINALTQSENLLFVLNMDNDAFLSIFDLSDPTHPIKLSDMKMPYGYTYINYQNGLLTAWCELWSCQEIGQFDISDPGQPQMVNGWRLPIDIQSIIPIDDNRFMTSSYRDGMWLLDLSNKEAPVLNGRIFTTSAGFGVKLNQPGSLVLTVPSYEGGFYLLRIE